MDLGNYRPISLTSTMSKVFEKKLKKRLLTFVNKYKPIATRQFGFQEGKSAQDAIGVLVSAISDAMGWNILALNIFVDLKKAFDSVDHNALLDT